MKDYIQHHPWKIVEQSYEAEHNKISESLLSIGNGHMGQRANFEESFSGPSLQGSYMAGVYYPDKTRVGWWKNGYPEYFAKVLNAANWIGLGIRVNGCELDIAASHCRLLEFSRELDMQEGILRRRFRVEIDGVTLALEAERFVSMQRVELGAICYQFLLQEGSQANIEICTYVDGNVQNEDANYQEFFWEALEHRASEVEQAIFMRTKKTGFHVYTAIATQLSCDGPDFQTVQAVNPVKAESRDGYAAQHFTCSLTEGQALVLHKYAAAVTCRDYPVAELPQKASAVLAQAQELGFAALREEHSRAWAQIWQQSDIEIDGDVAAQQGIRFNIFQLRQTYSGKDERLNIGPKGFTGEKYGGASYWDTEAYCLPFFLNTSEPRIARQLLLYRYKHLPKAIENAEKLGFSGGAALYPMVTMNGEECHNEWEITFEEIHRNGAIAYAIYSYIEHTGDETYLLPYGLEVLVGIARFWRQRVNWSEDKQKYVILGVTGPNEYENNINNNFYTNYLAAWCLRYTAQLAVNLAEQQSDAFAPVARKLSLDSAEWQDFTCIAEQIYLPLYLPKAAKQQIYLQQDGFLDKEIRNVEAIAAERPINQNWSWDRILRSCYIKQADTLQTFFFFEDDFSREELKRHFDFYEPLTVHESSLSPCVHNILANVLSYDEKAYEMYLRTSRLDLDDYNNDTEDGCHITSMAGTWMSVVLGYGGLRYRKQELYLRPQLPAQWQGYRFRILHRSQPLTVELRRTGNCLLCRIENHGNADCRLFIGDLQSKQELHLAAGQSREFGC